MPDIYLNILDQSDDVLQTIAEAMEVRANDPSMRRICADYMGSLNLPEGGRILEIGCGAGAATRHVLSHAAPEELVGVDPSAGLLEIARDALSDDPQARFDLGDAVNSGQPDAGFDIVLAHTVYSHLPDPGAALAEAMRVLKPGGHLVVFDGDYATITVALFDGDPLQSAVGAVHRNLVHAPFIMRQLPAMMENAGFGDVQSRSYGFVQTQPADYMISLIERSMQNAVKAGEMAQDLASGYVAEARHRESEGRFYGAILFVCHAAQKPATA